jgi:hypothetical protein
MCWLIMLCFHASRSVLLPVDEATVCPKLCPHVPTLLHLRTQGEGTSAAAGKWSEIKMLSDIVMS